MTYSDLSKTWNEGLIPD